MGSLSYEHPGKGRDMTENRHWLRFVEMFSVRSRALIEQAHEMAVERDMQHVSVVVYIEMTDNGGTSSSFSFEHGAPLVDDMPSPDSYGPLTETQMRDITSLRPK